MEYRNRSSIRLSGYDYAQSGYYFVTICTHDKKCILGNIVHKKMIVNDFGNVVENILKSLPDHHPIKLDIFQIMPNHIHIILSINGRGCARTTPTNQTTNTNQSIATSKSKTSRMELFQHIVSGSLPCIIRSFKSECTKQIHVLTPNIEFWQRNYYDHIIRNEKEYLLIKRYIRENPLYWDTDEENV